MPTSQLTELALRTAVNAMNYTNASSCAEEVQEQIKKVAIKRAQELIQGQGTAADVSKQLAQQSELISVALQVLTLAITAVNEQLNVLKQKRLSFDKERIAGIATFIIPKDKEERDFSKEIRVIYDFLYLASNEPLWTYFGIQKNTLNEAGKQASFYSVLPFYRMSDALQFPALNRSPVDKQRGAIKLFFRSALPEALADIHTHFHNDSKFSAFFISAYEGTNYLNHLRAPRFLMMSLANLLWNLQHPVDPKTGFPLNLEQCIKLCRSVERLLNHLLNSEAPPYLQRISTQDNELMSFVRQVEVHTKALRKAYAEEQLHELHITDVTNSAHHALRIMDKNVFKLIFKRYNPITKKEEPNEKAADELAYAVSYLQQLLARNPDLMSLFKAYQQDVPKNALLHTPPSTVMDALIIYCHLTTKRRLQLLAEIKKIGVDSALEFRHTLLNFYKQFIKPIKDTTKKSPHASHLSKSALAQQVAQHLIPLITLVIGDYRLDVEAVQNEVLLLKSPLVASKPINKGMEQVQQINSCAEKGNDYYRWSISPYLHASGQMAKEFDEIPRYQYRMTQMTNLLDHVGELVQHYRSLLQHETFQQFLIKCLSKVKAEYAALDKRIEKIDTYLSSEEALSRSLQTILLEFTTDLDASLDAFVLAAANLERVISMPDFTEQQKQLLSNKMGQIHEQFFNLFGEDSGFHGLIETLPIAPPPETLLPSSLPNPTAKTQQVALLSFLERCYNSLSPTDKQSKKGLFFRQSMDEIHRHKHLTTDQIKSLILDVARLAPLLQSHTFFNSLYGQSRFAKVFYKAVKDPLLNQDLPLARSLFGDNVKLSALEDKNISQQLKRLHANSETLTLTASLSHQMSWV